MRRYGVKALHVEIQNALARRFQTVLVEGEVSALTVAGNGHRYGVLREEDAILHVVIWRNHWLNLRHRPSEGERVVCSGRIDVYDRRGTYQLYVNDVQPAGEGKLARELAERKARLMAEGLLDPRRKRPLPPFPRFVGVATSLGSAALQDFLEVSRARFPAARVLVAGCSVQGREAAASVLRAVELLVEDGRAEVVVVTRGGGSAQDLAAFQDEHLARALAHCPVPVVSAVGHQIDTTLADLVADGVAPTPTGAAVLVMPDGPALRRRIDAARGVLHRRAVERIRGARGVLAGLQSRLRHPGQRLAAQRQRLVELETRLQRATRSVVARRRSTLQPLQRGLQIHGPALVGLRRGRVRALQDRLQALSPLAVLDRGYALATRSGHVLTDASGVAPGDRIEVRLARGHLAADVVHPQGSTQTS